MDKKDEKRVREIAREEALKCIREESAKYHAFASDSAKIKHKFSKRKKPS
jgi:hypothetical protein